MNYRSTQDARRELSNLAQMQGGYFTAKQAAAAGYGKRHLDYHVKAGNFERVERGLFRLPEIPSSEHDDLIRLSLWSRGRDDRPQAVVSHETALAVHGLGELLPTRTHLIVPRSFRKKPPAGCMLHKSQLAAGEVEEHEGFRVTKPLRTLLDVAEQETVTQEQLNQVVKQALVEGIVRRIKLTEAVERQAPDSRSSARFRLLDDGMMTRTFNSPAAFRQALERRLKTMAEDRAVPLNTLRLKLLIERLLARLFARPNPPWLLKGGYALELRCRPRARTTKDIDLTMGADERVASLESRLERIRDELQTAADIDLGDYLEFLIAASRTELLGAPQGGARFPVQARMAGRVFGSFHIDVGIGDALHGRPERLQGEDLLAFAGIVPAEVLAIPEAQQFAEKVHAYTFPWTDRTNTRSRDLVDIVLLIETGHVTHEEVGGAIQATFRCRGTHEIPTVLPNPPASWTNEFAALATEAQLKARSLAGAFATFQSFWADVPI